MTVIPAQVAGVKRICARLAGRKAETMAAAAMLGTLYRVEARDRRIGGTETITRVDKIVGPKRYVTAAKKPSPSIVQSTCWPARQRR
jgi:histidinol dehydrogenase